jgi:predicted Zn-dependent protease
VPHLGLQVRPGVITGVQAATVSTIRGQLFSHTNRLGKANHRGPAASRGSAAIALAVTMTAIEYGALLGSK